MPDQRITQDELLAEWKAEQAKPSPAEAEPTDDPREMIRRAAAALGRLSGAKGGRLGGKSKSEAKRRAAAANIAKARQAQAERRAAARDVRSD